MATLKAPTHFREKLVLHLGKCLALAMVQNISFVRKDGRQGVSIRQVVRKRALLANWASLVLQTNTFGCQMHVAAHQTYGFHYCALQI